MKFIQKVKIDFMEEELKPIKWVVVNLASFLNVPFRVGERSCD